jgi:hypothetical protein
VRPIKKEVFAGQLGLPDGIRNDNSGCGSRGVYGGATPGLRALSKLRGFLARYAKLGWCAGDAAMASDRIGGT